VSTANKDEISEDRLFASMHLADSLLACGKWIAARGDEQVGDQLPQGGACGSRREERGARPALRSETRQQTVVARAY
jgi:hypothetical protein